MKIVDKKQTCTLGHWMDTDERRTFRYNGSIYVIPMHGRAPRVQCGRVQCMRLDTHEIIELDITSHVRPVEITAQVEELH